MIEEIKDIQQRISKSSKIRMNLNEKYNLPIMKLIGIDPRIDKLDIFQNSKDVVYLIASECQIDLTDEAYDMLDFLFVPSIYGAQVERSSDSWELELAQMLLISLETQERHSSIRVMSSDINNSVTINNQGNLRLIHVRINEELLIAYPTYEDILGFPPLTGRTLYTKEQLEKIIKYEKRRNEKERKLNRLTSLPYAIDSVVSGFKVMEVFDNNIKSLKTNEAVFLYDILYKFELIELERGINGEPVESSLNNQGKFQKIKEYLRTIEKRRKI
ncbi:hypothetical protein LJC28_04260 [Dysgonomonas sp. OttesenSCG-928-D17]|nr:hypothetical protein [Dysgonomonas sp. OttesenSCG-928-D17]